MSDPRDEARGLSAAEHVLGVTSEAERAQAEVRMADDPAFAVDVQRWESRLGALAEEIAPVEPRAGVWTALEQATRSASSRPRLRPASQGERASGRPGFWRAWAVGASALAAACLAAAIFTAVRQPEAGHQMVARVMSTGGAPDIVLAYDTGTRVLVSTPLGPAPPAGMVPRLWLTHPDGSMTPIGDLDMTHPRQLRIGLGQSKAVETANGVVVSLESRSHAASSRPAGPLVAAGRFDVV